MEPIKRCMIVMMAVLLTSCSPSHNDTEQSLAELSSTPHTEQFSAEIAEEENEDPIKIPGYVYSPEEYCIQIKDYKPSVNIGYINDTSVIVVSYINNERKENTLSLPFTIGICEVTRYEVRDIRENRIYLVADTYPFGPAYSMIYDLSYRNQIA